MRVVTLTSLLGSALFTDTPAAFEPQRPAWFAPNPLESRPNWARSAELGPDVSPGRRARNMVPPLGSRLARTQRRRQSLLRSKRSRNAADVADIGLVRDLRGDGANRSALLRQVSELHRGLHGLRGERGVGGVHDRACGGRALRWQSLAARDSPAACVWDLGASGRGCRR